MRSEGLFGRTRPGLLAALGLLTSACANRTYTSHEPTVVYPPRAATQVTVSPSPPGAPSRPTDPRGR